MSISKVPLIESLIDEGNSEQLKKALNGMIPFEISEVLSRLDEDRALMVFDLLDLKLATESFEYLSTRLQQSLLKNILSSKAAAILNELSPDERTKFLQELPREVVSELVKLLHNEERILTLTLLGYPDDSVGRLMTPDYIAVGKDWSVEDILKHVQNYGHDSETIDYLYVVDDDGKLLGEIKIRHLLFTPKEALAESITDRNLPSLHVNDNDEMAVEIFQRTNRTVLPVIDEGYLLGIVTIDDILELSQEEATEDIQKIGGSAALEEPYMQTPFIGLMKKRAGWLMILFIGEMLTATALSYFEDEISKAVVLALFIPLIVSSGGNAGSQASTLIIRAMALGEITLKDWWRVVRREFASGLFLGTALALVGFSRIYLWQLYSNIYGPHWLLIALTVCLSLIGVVLWGTLSGALLPLLLRALKLDPATSSAPFVATLVDVAGILIYFVIAVLLLTGKLL